MIKETNNRYSNKNNNFDYKSLKILIIGIIKWKSNLIIVIL
jgi:hypothetical protein